MSSRSFPASALANSIEVGTAIETRNVELHADTIEPGSPVLIPGLDLMNHRPLTKVTWQWGSINSRLVVNEETASGLQIYNNYGPKSNEECAFAPRASDNTY